MPFSVYNDYKILISADKFQGHGPLRSFFVNKGFTVLQAADSLEALSVALQEQPHIVIINLLGDKLNANEFCRKLYKTEPSINTKVLVVSSFKSKDNILNVIESGAADYILTPFKNEELLNRVKYHLRNVKIIETKMLSSVLHDERVDVIFRILELLSKGYTPQKTLFRMTTHLNELLPVKRCNIIAGGSFSDAGFVAASNDDPNFHGFKLDLMKYPEIQQALHMGKIILIEDIGNDPIMKNVKNNLKNVDFNSIVVVPVKFKDAIIGVLSVRTKEQNKVFSEEEVQLCHLIGVASSGPLNSWRYVNRDLINHYS